jgi:hypothetical protein
MEQGERRASNIEAILVTLGGIKQLGESTHEAVNQLNTKVGIQNGRIGKLEQQQSFYRGAIWIFVIINVPILLYIIKELISHVKFVG